MRRTGIIILALAAFAPMAAAILPGTATDLDTLFPSVARGWNPANPSSNIGSFVAVGSRHIITARHVGTPTHISFDPTGAGGMLVEIDSSTSLQIPGVDLKLLKTKEDVPFYSPIDWDALETAYTHTQSGSNITFTPTGGAAEDLMAAGFGGSGGLNGAGTGYSQTIAAGMRHSAAFHSDSRGDVTYNIGGVPHTSATIISFLLENGDGALAGFDSGGGLFKNVNGAWHLVGINAFQLGTPYLFPNPDLQFASGFIELRPYRAQIEAFVVPEPASLAALGLGALALLRRRKK